MPTLGTDDHPPLTFRQGSMAAAEATEAEEDDIWFRNDDSMDVNGTPGGVGGGGGRGGRGEEGAGLGAALKLSRRASVGYPNLFEERSLLASVKNISLRNNAYVQNRDGSILGKSMVIKSDRFPHVMSANPLRVIGVPNFRQAPGCPLYGFGQPNVAAVRGILNLLRVHQYTPYEMRQMRKRRESLAAAAAAAGIQKEEPQEDVDVTLTQPPRGHRNRRHRRAVWINLREEPIVYINMRPYVLRELEHPFRNMVDFTAIGVERLEAIEEQLKTDIIEEAEQNYGNILAHEEVQLRDVSACWESVSPSTVQTSKDVAQALQREGYALSYRRIPVTAESAFEPRQFDALTRAFLEAMQPEDGGSSSTETVFLFNCQLGRGRSTVAMMAVYLTRWVFSGKHLSSSMLEQVLQLQHLYDATPRSMPQQHLLLLQQQNVQQQREEEEGTAKYLTAEGIGGEEEEGGDELVEDKAERQQMERQAATITSHLKEGNYDIIRRLLRIVGHGRLAKDMVDEAIVACGQVFNLRDAILQGYVKAERERDSHRQEILEVKVVENIRRYFYLICYASYLNDLPKDLYTRVQTQESPLQIRPSETGVWMGEVEVPSFEFWMEQRPHLKVLETNFIRSDLQLISQPPSAMTQRDREVFERSGSLLGSKTILKIDTLPPFIPGARTFPQTIPQAPNFRRLKDLPLASTAQPSVTGIRKVLKAMGLRPRVIKPPPLEDYDGKAGFSDAVSSMDDPRPQVLWINLREEPIVFLKGTPMVLRDFHHPFRTMSEFRTGVTPHRAEKFEARLKRDVLVELEQNQGRILVHKETKDHQLKSFYQNVRAIPREEYSFSSSSSSSSDETSSSSSSEDSPSSSAEAPTVRRRLAYGDREDGGDDQPQQQPSRSEVTPAPLDIPEPSSDDGGRKQEAEEENDLGEEEEEEEEGEEDDDDDDSQDEAPELFMKRSHSSNWARLSRAAAAASRQPNNETPTSRGRSLDEGVFTSREVFESLRNEEGFNVRYFRVPLHVEAVPGLSSFDYIYTIMQHHLTPKTTIVFSCQKGGRRSTVGLVVASLVLLHEGLLRFQLHLTRQQQQEGGSVLQSILPSSSGGLLTPGGGGEMQPQQKQQQPPASSFLQKKSRKRPDLQTAVTILDRLWETEHRRSSVPRIQVTQQLRSQPSPGSSSRVETGKAIDVCGADVPASQPQEQQRKEEGKTPTERKEQKEKEQSEQKKRNSLLQVSARRRRRLRKKSSRQRSFLSSDGSAGESDFPDELPDDSDDSDFDDDDDSDDHHITVVLEDSDHSLHDDFEDEEAEAEDDDEDGDESHTDDSVESAMENDFLTDGSTSAGTGGIVGTHKTPKQPQKKPGMRGETPQQTGMSSIPEDEPGTEALSRGTLIEEKNEHQQVLIDVQEHKLRKERARHGRGEYKGILSLIRILKQGALVKEEVDHVIDLCGERFNVRDSIAEALVGTEDSHHRGTGGMRKDGGGGGGGEDQSLRTPLRYLESYAYLLCFNAYLRYLAKRTRQYRQKHGNNLGDGPGRRGLKTPMLQRLGTELQGPTVGRGGSTVRTPAGSFASFTSWLGGRLELRLALDLLRQDAGDSLKASSMLSDSRYAHLLDYRIGSVLTPGVIMKHDYFMGCRSPNLPQPIEGSINFRSIAPFPVSGSGIPTALGMENIVRFHAGLTYQTKAEQTIVVHCTVPSLTEPDAGGVLGVQDPQLARHKVGGKRRRRQRTDGDFLYSRLVWLNLREEPILYVKGQPYVLRDLDNPYSNLEHTGITSVRVEAMERTLKADVLREAAMVGGRILLHDETPEGELEPVWVQIRARDVLTPQEQFQKSFQRAISSSTQLSARFQAYYMRTPITDEQAPTPDTIDDIVHILETSFSQRGTEDVAMLFNCQMGRGRTTTGMIIGALWCLHRKACLTEDGGVDVKKLTRAIGPTMSLEEQQMQAEMAKLGEAPDHDPKTTEDAHDISVDVDDVDGVTSPKALEHGWYQPIRRLVRLLPPHGELLKKQTDAVIDHCSAMQNLRTVVYKTQVLLGQCLPRKRALFQKRGYNYLVRYFFLIAFNAYCFQATQVYAERKAAYLEQQRKKNGNGNGNDNDDDDGDEEEEEEEEEVMEEDHNPGEPVCFEQSFVDWLKTHPEIVAIVDSIVFPQDTTRIANSNVRLPQT